MSDFDTFHSPVPVCPWCGYENSTDELYESTVIDCGNEECEKPISVEVDYDIHFSTSRSYVHQKPIAAEKYATPRYPCCNGYSSLEHSFSEDPTRWTCPEAINESE